MKIEPAQDERLAQRMGPVFLQSGLEDLAAAAEVSFVLWGWLFAQYPYVIPPALTIREAAAPAVTLRLLAIGLAAGAIVLLPSLRYMFKVFKTNR